MRPQLSVDDIARAKLTRRELEALAFYLDGTRQEVLASKSNVSQPAVSAALARALKKIRAVAR